MRVSCPSALSEAGRGPFARTSRGHSLYSTNQVLLGPRLCRGRRYGRGKRERNHRITQLIAVARLAAEAVDDVLHTVHFINGRRGITAIRTRNGPGIKHPQDLARRRRGGIEEPRAVAEEHQIARYRHARAGMSGQDRNRPGNLARRRADRAVHAVIHTDEATAEYRSAEQQSAVSDGAHWRAVSRVRRSIRLSDIHRTVARVR